MVPVVRALMSHWRSRVLKGISTRLVVLSRSIALSGYMTWWVVLAPTSPSKPVVGAWFILMMKSLESMMLPYWDPFRFPEFPTTEQVLQRSGLASMKSTSSGMTWNSSSTTSLKLAGCLSDCNHCHHLKVSSERTLFSLVIRGWMDWLKRSANQGSSSSSVMHCRQAHNPLEKKLSDKWKACLKK